MTLNEAGLDFIAGWEGCELEAYQDQGGTWTIGYGHTEGVTEGEVWTQDHADIALADDAQTIAADPVNQLVTVPLTQNMFNALCDFTYNLGQGNLSGSTLLQLLNQHDYSGAQNQFQYWDLCDGVPNQGLENRRLAEAQLFGTPDGEPEPDNEPTYVDRQEIRMTRGSRLGRRV